MADTHDFDLDRWIEHYDYLDADFAAEPAPVWRELRGRCPIVHSDLYGGYWVPLNYADVGAIAHDPAVFASRGAGVPPNAFGEEVLFPPITSDPPEHAPYRRMLLAAFAPGQMQRWEPVTWEIAERLIDGLIDADTVDVAVGYARNVPITVIARMLGVDETDAEMFAAWLPYLIETGPTDFESARRAIAEMNAYLSQKISEHRQYPRDDILTFLIDTEVDGRRLDDAMLLDVARLLLIAGIDTTWSSIGSSLNYLATHAEDRRRLVDALDDPDSTLWATAIEEFLRAFAPVALARRVTQDTEVAGQPVCAGEQVLLTFGAANRDPDVFDQPDNVVIDREFNRHYAFGVGIHRCLGSNLARMELRVGLQAFLRRIPEFSLKPGGRLRYGGGPIRGPKELEITIDRRGPRS